MPNVTHVSVCMDATLTFLTHIRALIKNTLSQSMHEGWQSELTNLIKVVRTNPKTHLPEERKELDERAIARGKSFDSGTTTKPVPEFEELIDIGNLSQIFGKYFHYFEADEKNKTILIQRLEEISRLRNLITGHPDSTDASIRDSRSYIDGMSRVLQILKCQSGSRALETIYLKLEPVLVEASDQCLISKLPPREAILAEFVGRENELAQLQEWVCDANRKTWALYGQGGMGKSAIAYEFCSQIINSSTTSMNAVVWLTAKTRQFREGEIVSTIPDFWDLNSALNYILNVFGCNDTGTFSEEQKKQKVIELAHNFQCLFVIDDLDSLDHDAADAGQFLMEELPTRSNAHILVTTRRLPFMWANRSTEITGLSYPSDIHFFESCVQRFGINPPDIIQFRDTLLALTDRCPLYIEEAVRLISLPWPVSEVLKIWRRPTGVGNAANARKFTFEKEFELLSQDARDILMTCTVSDDGCSFSELRTVLDDDEQRLMQALSELKSFSVKPTNSENGNGYFINNNIRNLVKSTQSSTDAFRRIERILKILRHQQAPSEIAKVSEYKAKIIGLLKDASEDAILEALRCLESYLRYYPENPVLIDLQAQVFVRIDRIAEAKASYDKLERLRKMPAKSYLAYANLLLRQEEFRQAIVVLERGIAAYPHALDLYRAAGFACSRLGCELYNNQDGTAESVLEKSCDFYKHAFNLYQDIPEDAQLEVGLYRGLVIGLAYLGKQAEAQRYLSEWRARHHGDMGVTMERDRLNRKFPHLWLK